MDNKALLKLATLHLHTYEKDPYVSYVVQEWTRADSDKSGKLKFSEVEKLLKKINIKLKTSVIKEKFEKADASGDGELEFEEFIKFLEDLRTRLELKELFAQYSKKKPVLNVEDFRAFLKNEQKEDLSADKVKQLIAKFPRTEPGLVSFTAFSEYISSAENSAYNPVHRNTVYQDMTRPFSNYYIASSHNTYLMGHQLKGDSSVEAYKNALLRGCRCVELDCWDGENGEPIVTHGHTMTSKIKFRDVVNTIKKHAFEVTSYPLILSLENHCSVEQQVVMADIFNTVLGSAGLLPKSWVLEQTRPLPSPGSLKNKILIKGKVLSPGQTVIEEPDSSPDENEDDVESDEEHMNPKPATSKKEPVKPSLKEKVTPREGKKDTPREGKKDTPREGKKETPREGKTPRKEQKVHVIKLAKPLSDLTHLKAVSFGGFAKFKGPEAPWEMTSLSEHKTIKLIKTEYKGIVTYNVHQISRVYPKGTRFDSSNLHPIPGWLVGCQMVALNYQTASIPMWLNSGKFLDNGGCGYLLKPAALLNPDTNVDKLRMSLSVKIISGWQLPKVSGTTKGEIIDPYVKFSVYGMENDQMQFKTKTVSNNGFNPLWNETIQCRIDRPDVAILLFRVFDEDTISKDDFIGYFSVPVLSVRPGYRTVPLLNGNGQSLEEASLLVHFKLA